MRNTILLLLTCLSCATAWSATTPEEIATEYFDDFREGKVHAFTAAMHPDEMIKFKDLILPVIVRGLAAPDEKVGMLGFKKLAGSSTLEQLNAEAPEVFFTRFMTWLMEMDPSIKEVMAGTSVEMIGHITEEDMAHVVYRMHVDLFGVPISEIGTVSLKKLGDRWMMMLTGEVEGLNKILDANLTLLIP